MANWRQLMWRLPPLRSTVLAGSGFTLLMRLLAALSGLFLTVMLTRLLSQAEIGQYFILLSAVSIASVTIGCGLNFSVVRFVAEAQALQQPALTKGVMAAALMMLAGSGMLLGMVLLSSWGEAALQRYLLQPVGWPLAAVLLIWTVALALQTLFAEMFRGMQMILLAALFGGVLASGLTLGLLAVRLLFAPPTLIFVLAMVRLGALISVTLAAGLMWHVTRRLPGAPVLPWRRLAQTSLPLWITNLMLVVLMQADLWILHSQGNSAQVALYGAASRLIQFLTLPLLVLNAALMPLIATRHTLGEQVRLQTLLRSAAALASTPALLAILAFLLVGAPLLHLFYGAGYEAAKPLLLILSLGQLSNVLCGSAGYTLMMTGRQQDMMWFTAAAGVLMIGLGLLLVKPYGAIGVACAAAFSLGMQSLVMWWRVKAALGIWTHAPLRLLLRPLEAFRTLQ